MKAASKLFNEIDIKYVFMEWITYGEIISKDKKSIMFLKKQFIKDFFYGHGYNTYQSAKDNSPLERDDQWPSNVFFKK